MSTNKIDSTKLTNSICNMLGINPENINVNCNTYSVKGNGSDPDTDVVDVKVDLKIPSSTTSTKIEIPITDGKKTPEKASGVEIFEAIEEIKASDEYAQTIQKKLKDLTDLANKYNLKENASTLVGQFVDNLGNLISDIRGKYNDAMTELETRLQNNEAEAEVCDCDVDDYPDCENCDDWSEGCDDCDCDVDGDYITAASIKENLKKKFAAVKENALKEKYKDFCQYNHNALVDAIFEKLESEEYSSLTNDLDAENAGIAITFTKEETDEMEQDALELSGYSDYLSETYISEILLPKVAQEIVDTVEFSSGMGWLNSIDGSVTFKFLF